MFIKSFFTKHILITAALIVVSLNANAQGVDPAYTPFPAVEAGVHGGLIVPLPAANCSRSRIMATSLPAEPSAYQNQ